MVLEISCTLGENFWTLRELDHDTPLADKCTIMFQFLQWL